MFDPLPSTFPGSDQRLKVVVYRKGSELIIYFLDELKAYTYTNVNNDYRLLNCFDSSKTLCFYDTISSTLRLSSTAVVSVKRTNEVISVLTRSAYPIIVTASQPEVNVFATRNALKDDKAFCLLTYNLWTLPELYSVYMYHKIGVRYDAPKDQNYERIAEINTFTNVYGSSLRSIRPRLARDLAYDFSCIKKAINSLDFTELWELKNNYYSALEPFVHQYVFHLATNRTEEINHTTVYLHRIKPASNLVIGEICGAYLNRYSQDILVHSMQMIVKYSHVWSLWHFSMLLQLYISRQISAVGGTDGWTVRANQVGSELRPFDLHMPVERGDMPAFSDMLQNVLYIPELGLRHFLIYKSANIGTGAYELNLIRADLTSQPLALIRTGTVRQVYDWLKMDLSTTDIKCNYYICPLRDAHSCVVSTTDNEPMPSFLGSISIIHLPQLFEPVSVSTEATVNTISSPPTAPITVPASSETLAAHPQSSASQQRDGTTGYASFVSPKHRQPQGK